MNEVATNLSIFLEAVDGDLFLDSETPVDDYLL
jgi:hypothetical protein